jgi:hypothetical protein
MKLSVLTIAVLFSTILSSCCHEVQCTNNDTLLNNITFFNFQKSDLDTVIVRRFTQNTNFAIPIDSFILDSLNSHLDYYPYDSTATYSIYDFVGNSFNIAVGYDYEIFIPVTNTLAQISNILEPQSETKICPGGDYTPTGCVNGITSIYNNGQPQANTTGIFINK